MNIAASSERQIWPRTPTYRVGAIGGMACDAHLDEREADRTGPRPNGTCRIAAWGEMASICIIDPLGVATTFSYVGSSLRTPSTSTKECGLISSAYPSDKPTYLATGITLFRRWIPPGAPDGGFELSLKSSRGSGSTRACAWPFGNGGVSYQQALPDHWRLSRSCHRSRATWGPGPRKAPVRGFCVPGVMGSGTTRSVQNLARFPPVCSPGTGMAEESFRVRKVSEAELLLRAKPPRRPPWT